MNPMSKTKEALTGYIGVISSDHAYIHKGIGKTINIQTGPISSVYRIGFTTPDVASNQWAHWRPIGLTTSADYVKAELTEADSFSGGTDILSDIFTRNRNQPDTTDMQAFAKGVTSTPVGTILQQAGIGASGNPSSQSGGGGGADEEIVLKPNTDYVITLTPDGATEVLLTLFWYEERAFKSYIPA